MFDGLKELGLSPLRSGKRILFSNGQYDTETNTLTLNGSNVEKRTSEIKQAYSGAVVKAQAKKYGWQLKETSKFNYVVQKRSI